MPKSTILQLKGFEEFYEKLQAAGKNVDAEAEKLFDQCLVNLHDELKAKSIEAGLAPRLIRRISGESKVLASHNIFRGEVGWKVSKSKNPLSDSYKVIFYNYGTPARSVKKENQRMMIDGKWVTASNSRGKEPAHGFIKRAKLAAYRRNNKLMKDALKEMLGDLGK